MKILQNFIANETGATTIEYGLIASLLGIAIISSLSSLGNGLGSVFGRINKSLAPVVGGPHNNGGHGGGR